MSTQQKKYELNFAPQITTAEATPDLVCLSHLRWDFVYQRPQHLLTRCAEGRRVFFFEEPVYDGGPLRLEVKERGRVRVVVPHLPEGLTSDVAREASMRTAVERMFADFGVSDYVLWYYTPMALQFTRHLRPRAVVYDCMDELSAFKGASPLLRGLESELMSRADLVFTGGQSLYEAKRDRHPRVHAFPSSIDAEHFGSARGVSEEPADQTGIPRPRLGFFGVIDERLDIELIDEVARLRPDWQLVMVGPVVKIDPAALPHRENIHYLGMKSYEELPAYLSGWDVALLPFARNESTRFISPTKTPEYLAAGKPVVSTSIRDVVRPYGQEGYVRIADTAEEFVAACEAALIEDAAERCGRVDPFLSQTSWDGTWASMNALIDGAVAERRAQKFATAKASGGASLARGATVVVAE
ncbi:MAG TPA: glycosyltransferase family 1 protein [Pyrinomonadaceae bacterium]|jgi:UDP-galactopyranose mutase|nr:glycosyltransferase family 1 protein [Pyrinomonadaceae bacterium]